MPMMKTETALAGAVVLLFAAVIFAAFAIGEVELAKTLAQVLANVFIAVVSFYFGSSQGSRAKDEAARQDPPQDAAP